MLDRAAAWSLLAEFTQSDNLRKHALAVEAAMRAYATRYAEDVEAWGVAGMLHDFDYEMHPAAPQHPMKGAEILLARGAGPLRVRRALGLHHGLRPRPPGARHCRPRAGLGQEEAQGQGLRAHGQSP